MPMWQLLKLADSHVPTIKEKISIKKIIKEKYF